MNQEVMHAKYSPARLLDFLQKQLNLQGDGALSRKLKVASSVIRKIRHGVLPIGASMLLWMQEATGIHVEDLRRQMGDRRGKLRLCYPIRSIR